MDVEAIVEQLTLEEKVALLTGTGWWHTTAIDRLSIPSIRLSDGPNGIRGTHFFDSTPSACLPCGTALGATFDVEIAERIGQLLADEAHAKGVHVVLGPTINIQRSPLGGRGFESFSEDPVVSGMIAAYYVRGLQESGVSATLKHFVCNDMESERMAVDALVTERALREIYLLPFMLAIEIAQPRAVMTSYSKLNGTHAAENSHILSDILRGEWKWNGLVMSDWFGTYSTSEAINSGLDLEMPGPTRWRGEALKHAFTSNKIKPSTLDERVRNVLKMVKQGIENTSIPSNAPETELNTPEHISLLREAAANSVVLLKNNGDMLPFSPDRTVAVIGPNANIATYCGGGSASLRAYSVVSPLEGIQQYAKDATFSQGAYGHQMLPLLGKQLRTVDGKRQGFTLRMYNEPPSNEGNDTRHILDERVLNETNPWFVDYDNPELSEVWYAEAEGVFTPTATGEWEFGLAVHGTGELFIDGELIISNVKNQQPGSSFLGSGTIEMKGVKNVEAGRQYRILAQWGCSKTSELKVSGGVDFGQGGLRFSGCPKLDADTSVAEAVKVAKSVDQVVLCIGTSGEWESEGQDRQSMALPPGTDELVEAILKANPNTAVVVQSGTPVSMPWADKAPAILQAWFGGNECGNGIADVLFGSVNPAAKLPMTIPRCLADNPAALSFRAESHRVLYSEDVYVGYRWYDTLDIEPLFAFGHGLSYTSFALSDLQLTNKGEELLVSVQVTNTGIRSGAEVVQVYVKPKAPTPLTASSRDAVTRPAKELKGFTKVLVDANSAKVAQIKLDLLRATSYWCETESCWRSDAGTYTILVGTSSRATFAANTFGLIGMRPSESIRDQIEETTRQATEVAVDNDRQQVNRTLARRACDACRARRRKCHFTNVPPKENPQSSDGVHGNLRAQCYDCGRLGLRCSFLIPTRTRGPKRRRQSQPNSTRVRSGEAEAISQQNNHAYSNTQPPQLRIAGPSVDFSSPNTITRDASPAVSDLELPTDILCSRKVLNIIMRDYLDRIYPLVPVVHRPTFRAQLAAHHDIRDSEFFALIIALAALTVGLLPSRFSYYQSMAPEVGSCFNSRIAMINFCIDTCMRLRTATYWDNTGQTNRSRMLEVEAMQIGRLLGIHRISDYDGLNCIETQLRKKAFWLIFYTTAHAWHQCCGREERLSFFDPWRLHEVNFEALIPLEVDDKQIFEHEIRMGRPVSSPACARTPEDQAKKAAFNLTIGFNIHSKVFLESTRIAFTPGNSDWAQRVPPDVRLAQLRQLLNDVRYMLDDVPNPMRQWAPWDPSPSPAFQDSSSIPSPEDWEGPHLHVPSGINDDNTRSLPGQIQIMRANLHGTHLWVQSVLLDRIDVILQERAQRLGKQSGDDSATAALKASWLEREDVCRQTLHLLHSSAYAHQEPNGLYFAYKIRDIGVALLNCPFEEQHPSARRAAAYIHEFARALSRLDRSEKLNISSLRSWVDTDRENPIPERDRESIHL